MRSYKETFYIFEDVCVNEKIMIAALWTAMMFLNLYVNHFTFFESIKDQTWLFAAVTLMIIPGLMIFLSLALKAKVNRIMNIIAGASYIVVVIIIMIGTTEMIYLFGAFVETILLLLIVRYAWTWPKEVA